MSERYTNYVAAKLQKSGFEDIQILSPDDSKGADILATSKNGVKVCIKCCYASQPIPAGIVQAAYQAKQQHQCSAAMVVTNSTFTEKAKTYAAESRVTLKEAFAPQKSTTAASTPPSAKSQALTPAAAASAAPVPQKKKLQCPECGSTNVDVQLIKEDAGKTIVSHAKTRAKTQYGGHGCLWWIVIGWWWIFIDMALWCLFFPFRFVVQLLKGRKSTTRSTTDTTTTEQNNTVYRSMCLCHDCGYHWEKKSQSETQPAKEAKPFYKQGWFIALLVILVLLFIGIIGGGGEDTEANRSDIPEAAAEQNDTPVLSDTNTDENLVALENNPDTSDSMEEGFNDLESIGDIAVDEGLFSVEITVPADFAGDTTQAELDTTAQEHGYKSATLNADGSVTYVMSKKQHNDMMDGLRESFRQQLNEMVGSEDFPDFVKVEANDDFTRFEITTKNTELSFMESLSTLQFYIISGTYHTFNGTTADNCAVIFINEQTGEVISEANSSEMGD